MKKRLVLLTLILTLAVFSIASGTEILFWAMDMLHLHYTSPGCRKKQPSLKPKPVLK